jgi:hypothetical protein
MQSSLQNLNNGMARLCLLIPLLILGLHPHAGALDLSAAPWVYLRGSKTPASGEHLVEIIAVGDVMLGRGLADTSGLFDHVAGELQGADLAIGNLEGVMAVAPSTKNTPSLYLPPGAAATLAEAGFDLLSLANNHTLDAGPKGLDETARRLQSAGVQPLLSASSVVREIDGLKIAFLAWNEIPSTRGGSLLAALRAVRPIADIVIILVHWGREYQRHPTLAQRELAGELLAAGADIILGSHPHVVQDLYIPHPESPPESPQLVAFSLGNFVFDQGWDDTGQGLAFRLLFDRSGLRAAQALPLRTSPRPRWMAPSEAVALLERILPVERTGFACSPDSCRAVPVPHEQRSGLFWSGAIDLTGDGHLEIIRRQGQAVEIYQDGQVAWHSPPEWRVLDLALGDPNDDGRYELLLVLEKPDPSGNVTSHPFIVGYRGGSYRLLWGGSPVSAPLLEAELGDLDGDGVAELAVIEAAQDSAARYVTIWHWYGWGFSLLWRSPLGEYHDLTILPPEDSLPARLSVSAGS